MPVGDLPGWTQIFRDDFVTAAPVGVWSSKFNSTWGAYKEGWADSTGHGYYFPDRVISSTKGMLNIFLHSETVNGQLRHLVGTPYPRLPGANVHNGMLYGRYAVRY